MKRIILHWTAGTNQPCNTDYEHYHFLVNKDGVIVKGKYEPKDNENCYDGKYAQHCGGGNTGSIGVAMCGMYVPKNVNIEETQYPLTKKQCESTFELIAKLAKQYNIEITPQTIMTHYEFGQKNTKTSSFGKVDIIYLHAYPELSRKEIGDFIRNKVRWYYERLK